MSIHPKPKIRRETVWPIALAATITWCSGFPATSPDIEWVAPDKLGHFVAYGVLATALVRHSSLARWPLLGGWWALPLASLYGLGDEFRQSLTTFRTYDLADWAADTLGAAVAVAIYLHWSWYRRWMERPFLGAARVKRAASAIQPVCAANGASADGAGTPAPDQVPSDK